MPSIKPQIGNPSFISLDDVCYLISITSDEADDLEQPIEIEVEREVFCSKLNISRQEYFAAGQTDLKPQIVIVVNADEYDAEYALRYGDQKYRIYRDFMRRDGHLELYCEVKAGG